MHLENKKNQREKKSNSKMVGQRTLNKPSRSDEVLDAEEQLKITNQIKAQFDALAPTRPLKPNRSEADDVHANPEPGFSCVDQHIAEIQKLRSLQSQSSHVILRAEGPVLLPDEYVETQYYTKLASVDKQHHTTGTGFIKAGKESRDGDGYSNTVMLQRSQDGSPDVDGVDFRSFRSNPATNDWIPRDENDD